MDKRDILVVFDIDETLIQFINKNAYHYWQEASPEQKRMIENNLNPNEINEMITHCKKFDYHESISFYQDLCLKLNWSNFNILFSSNFISFFTFIK
jgi:phosphoserine phosphatase